MTKHQKAFLGFSSGMIDTDRFTASDQSEVYNAGLRTLLNMIPNAQGGVYKRSGCELVGGFFNTVSYRQILSVPFYFDQEHAYALVLYANNPLADGDSAPADKKYRLDVYLDGALVSTTQNIEFSDGTAGSPPLDINMIKYSYQNDVIILTHPNMLPMIVKRTSNIAFTVEKFTDINAILLTGGNPSCSVFRGGRLYFAGFSKQPNRIVASAVGDYTDYVIPGTVLSTSPMDIILTGTNSPIINMFSARQLLVFTQQGEWYVNVAENEPITSANFSLIQSTSEGSFYSQPVSFGGYTTFLTKRGSVKQIVFSDSEKSYNVPSLSMYATSVLKSPVQMTAPFKILNFDGDYLCVLNENGTVGLLGFSKDAKFVAWSILDFGCKVLSVCSVNDSLYVYGLKKYIIGAERVSSGLVGVINFKKKSDVYCDFFAKLTTVSAQFTNPPIFSVFNTANTHGYTYNPDAFYSDLNSGADGDEFLFAMLKRYGEDVISKLITDDDVVFENDSEFSFKIITRDGSIVDSFLPGTSKTIKRRTFLKYWLDSGMSIFYNKPNNLVNYPISYYFEEYEKATNKVTKFLVENGYAFGYLAPLINRDKTLSPSYSLSGDTSLTAVAKREMSRLLDPFCVPILRDYTKTKYPGKTFAYNGCFYEGASYLGSADYVYYFDVGTSLFYLDSVPSRGVVVGSSPSEANKLFTRFVKIDVADEYIPSSSVFEFLSVRFLNFGSESSLYSISTQNSPDFGNVGGYLVKLYDYIRSLKPILIPAEDDVLLNLVNSKYRTSLPSLSEILSGVDNRYLISNTYGSTRGYLDSVLTGEADKLSIISSGGTDITSEVVFVLGQSSTRQVYGNIFYSSLFSGFIIRSIVETIPVSVDLGYITVKGERYRLTHLHVRLFESNRIKLSQYKSDVMLFQADADLMGDNAIPLKTEWLRFAVVGFIKRENTIVINHDAPIAFSINAIKLDFVV